MTGPGHPERPERLARIAEVFAERGIAAACVDVEPVPVALRHIAAVHDDEYVRRLEAACDAGLQHIDAPDSAICRESFEIAKLAAGTVLNAVDAVMAGRVDNAFCAVRPPGHHCERSRSMGFCLLNNVAVAARYLIDAHRIERILILDWDVHHGNGTQHTFEEDPRVLYVSIHGDPAFVYPGTGTADERGRGAGEGLTINVPMMPGSGDEAYRRAFGEHIMTPVADFSPEFVLISCGFDAHERDPLAPLSLETASFGWMTDELLRVAKACAGGRLVSLLEGGYDLDALGESAALHVTRLLEA